MNCKNQKLILLMDLFQKNIFKKIFGITEYLSNKQFIVNYNDKISVNR